MTDAPVDGGLVIEELLIQIANLHRDNAILRVQLKAVPKPVIESETPQ